MYVHPFIRGIRAIRGQWLKTAEQYPGTKRAARSSIA